MSASGYTTAAQPLIHDLEESILDLSVEKIRPSFLAAEYGVDPSAHLDTHAVLYLLTADGNSIELNMGSPSALTDMGRMIIGQRTFRRHRHCFKHWSLVVRPGLTVRDILRAIQEERRHIYQFHRSGLGCRYWVRTVINDFREHGFFYLTQNRPLRRFMKGVGYSYPRGQAPEKSPIVRGRFL
ncbi:hypothetical protein N7481_006706 [Penicillium waksmanii]|uniref:uncharacterized protein n=1 Tax=Penicillium waksmanii TaxID=69791 RepID=UPI00254841C3|nr:uncharacterized protein N7481_006706 [Penicillium waksmanii]KAJ5984607.1 hypothetical protein N7481_006706 [Penicillium waksmanii]